MSIRLTNAAHNVAMETVPLFYIPSWIKDGYFKMPIFWTKKKKSWLTFFFPQEYKIQYRDLVMDLHGSFVKLEIMQEERVSW